MKLKIQFIVIIFITLLVAKGVNAENIIGASPAAMVFKDVLRGGYSERPLTISVSNADPIRVSFQAWGDIAKWINFSQQNITLSRNQIATKIIVTPPADIPNGNYTGYVRVHSENLISQGQTGHATGQIIPVLDVLVTVEIIDLEIRGCRAENFEVNTVEKGEDLNFTFDTTNEGNIRLQPRVTINIWDQEQTSIVKQVEFVGQGILPTRTEEITYSVPTDDLENGQYWAEISAPDCLVTETITFDVLEPGTLRADGVLIKILGTSGIKIGETAPFTAFFKNTGEKEVNAQFRGQIKLDNQIVQLVESEQLRIAIGEIANLSFYFTPKKAGKYIVNGRVFYDKKRTYESSTILMISSENSIFKQSLIILLYISIAAGIIFLIYKIRKERKKLRLGLR